MNRINQSLAEAPSSTGSSNAGAQLRSSRPVKNSDILLYILVFFFMQYSTSSILYVHTNTIRLILVTITAAAAAIFDSF